MSVEPGVVDSNILVYAVDGGAPQHAISRALLEAARDPVTVLYLTSQALLRVLFRRYESPPSCGPAFPHRGDQRHFGSARATWHTGATHTCVGRSGLDGIVAASSRDWR
jgi:hypothetical protein